MASFSSESDPAQVLKNLLRIGVPGQSDSTDASEPSISSSVMQAIENFRISSDAIERRSTASSASEMMKMEMLGQQRREQQIVLHGDDQIHPIYGQHVEILASKSSGSTQTTPTSARVGVKSVVKYNSDYRYYSGNLVAVHQNEAFVAFAIMGKTDGVIRVFNSRTAERMLLRGFSGPVADIDFARSPDIILGCVDQSGNLHVFKILTASNGKLSFEIVLRITRPVPDAIPSESSCHRIIWCPFVPDKKEDEDCDDAASTQTAEMMLAVSSENIVRVLNVEAVSSKHGREPVHFNQLTSGCCIISGHLQRVTDMALVPDGSTLATASTDGMVRCFEIDLADSEPPRCIFKWKPHNGRPVSSIFFLDDLKNTSTDAPLWKFAVTGADENRELKVWSCETWSCLQTLTLSPPPNVPLTLHAMPCIKAGLDGSATYMVLSDIKREVLYVLRVTKDNSQDIACFSSVSEFLLAQPCLSLAIHSVTKKDLAVDGATSGSASCSMEPSSDVDELLSLYAIQTKSVEHLRLHLQPSSSDDPTDQSPGSDSGNLKLDRLSDVSNFSDSESASQTKRTYLQDSVQSLEMTQPSDTSSFTHITSMDEEERTTMLTGADFRSFHRHQQVFPQMPPPMVANESVTQDLGLVSASRELSHALAHISSIQIPVHGPLEAEAPPGCDRRSTASNASSRSLNSTSGARPKGGTSPPIADAAEEEEEARFLSASKDSAADAFSCFTSVPVGSSSTRNERKENGASSTLIGTEHDDPVRERLSQTSSKSTEIYPDGNGIQELQSHLHEISMLLREQRDALQLLRDDLRHQKSDPTCVIDSLQTKVNNLEMHCVSAIRETVEQFTRGSDDVLQNVAKDLDASEQQRLQQQLASLSQVVDNCLQSQLELTVHREMQQSILPGISRIFNPVTKRLNAELSQKLTATDALLKESITQMVKSKAVIDTIGKVAANSLETVLYAACRDQLIPSFDRGCQNILSQVDETFQKGIRMYMHQMQKRMDKMRKQPNDVVYSPVVHQIQGLITALAQAKDLRDPLRRQLTDLTGSVQHYTEQLEKQKTNLSTTLNNAISSLPMQLADSLREMIHNEVSQVLKEHQETVSEKIASTFQSRSATPAPQAATSVAQSQRMQITALVQRNQINAAFQLALSVMDLGVLMYVCEMVSPSDVFSQTPCPLDQPVLLSLIQQLSADLRTQTQLKSRYLEDALLNIDQTSSVMKDHLPLILDQLCKNAEAVLQSPERDLSLKRSMKMLILTARSLLCVFPSQSNTTPT